MPVTADFHNQNGCILYYTAKNRNERDDYLTSSTPLHRLNPSNPRRVGEGLWYEMVIPT